MTFSESVLPYRSAAWLSSGTEESAKPRHRFATPGSAAREALIARKLGVNGWGRWQYFRQCFSGQWGDEGQQPVSPRSQEALLTALEVLEFPAGVTPSLFLTDGRVAIDNNPAERALRPIGIGRKNWLFAGADTGAETLARAMTVIETAKLNGLDPQAYLADILDRIHDHKINRLDELLPWNRAPLNADHSEAA